MLWDLYRSDPFFRDLNYNPELFYRWKFGSDSNEWIDLGAIEHESNGTGGADERSWNRTYLRYHSDTNFGKSGKLFWSFKAWISYGYNPTNADINQFRGLWEVELTLTDFIGAHPFWGDVILRLYPGGPSGLNPFSGGQELTFRGNVDTIRFLPVLVAQLFHGYGENLIDYNVSHWAIRIGVGF